MEKGLPTQTMFRDAAVASSCRKFKNSIKRPKQDTPGANNVELGFARQCGNIGKPSSRKSDARIEGPMRGKPTANAMALVWTTFLESDELSECVRPGANMNNSRRAIPGDIKDTSGQANCREEKATSAHAESSVLESKPSRTALEASIELPAQVTLLDAEELPAMVKSEIDTRSPSQVSLRKNEGMPGQELSNAGAGEIG